MQVNKDAEGLESVWEANRLLGDVALKAIDHIRSSTSMTINEKEEFLEWATNRLKEVGITL